MVYDDKKHSVVRLLFFIVSYLSIAQNPFATETVVVAYIISFHCTEPLFYRDSRGRLYHMVVVTGTVVVVIVW